MVNQIFIVMTAFNFFCV